VSKKYYKVQLFPQEPASCVCWYEDEDGVEHDILCDDIPEDAVIEEENA